MKKQTLKTQIKELKDKYLRLHADFENSKRKSAEEKLKLILIEIIYGIILLLDKFINHSTIFLKKND